MPAYQTGNPHFGQSWSNASRDWVDNPNTAQVELEWDVSIKKFVGSVQLWTCDPPKRIEIDYTSDGSIKVDRWIVYISFHSGWQTQEAIAITKNKNTLRYKGWCIIHLRINYVDFYDMESTDIITMTVEEFGDYRFYFTHAENSGRDREKFIACCEDCFQVA